MTTFTFAKLYSLENKIEGSIADFKGNPVNETFHSTQLYSDSDDLFQTVSKNLKCEHDRYDATPYPFYFSRF